MQTLLRSRKFWLAVFGVVQSIVLYYFKVDETVWQSITALVMVLIAGIAIEDAGLKVGQGGVTLTRIEDQEPPQ